MVRAAYWSDSSDYYISSPLFDSSDVFGCCLARGPCSAFLLAFRSKFTSSSVGAEVQSSGPLSLTSKTDTEDMVGLLSLKADDGDEARMMG